MLTQETIILRLVVALALGGIVGLEREYKDKSAGFRTLTMISIGSCLFTLISIMYGGPSYDRIASNVVTGIGFLGAGVIFKNEKGVNGLTTAACIWATAAIGMAAGSGLFIVAMVATGMMMVVLLTLDRLEDWIDNLNVERGYRVSTRSRIDTSARYEQNLKDCRLKFYLQKTMLKERGLHFTWKVSGSKKKHDKFIQMLLKDDNIDGFEF